MLFPDDNGVIAMGLGAFRTTTGIEGFSLDNFEKKAEQFNKQYPGEGYQRAYEDALNQIFKAYVAGIAREEEPLVTLPNLVYSFDSFIMKPYMEGAKNHGIDVSVDINFKELNLKTLRRFDDIMNMIPTNTVMQDTYDKFKRNELTLDSVSEDVKARKNTVPTKEEALELVSRAAFLQERMESRGKWGTFLNWYTALREYLAINALKSLAAKAGNIDDLEREAEIGNPNLAALRGEVSSRLLNASSKIENEKILQRSESLVKEQNEMEDALDSEALDESALDGSLDLSQIDDAFTLDDGDASSVTSDEFDETKMSIVIEELSEQPDISQKFEKIEDKDPPEKGSISID